MSSFQFNPINDYIKDGEIFDEQKCTILGQISTYSFATFCGIFFVVSVFFNIKYLRNKNNMERSQFYLTAIFGIFSSILIVLSIRNKLMICYHKEFHILDQYETFKIFIIAYFVQIYLMWIILFQRTMIAFEVASIHKMTKCVINSFILIFVIGPILTIVFFVLSSVNFDDKDNNDMDDNTHRILNVICGVFVISLDIVFPLILTSIFVKKLLQIFAASGKNMDMNDIQSSSPSHQRMMKTITKSTVLCIISILFEIFTVVSFEFLVSTACWMVLLDIFVNFITIMFSYKCFDGYYMIFCGKCDKCINNIGWKWYERNYDGDKPRDNLADTSTNTANEKTDKLRVNHSVKFILQYYTNNR